MSPGLQTPAAADYELICLNAREGDAASCCSSDLLHQTAAGLLQPSAPLSAAAAAALGISSSQQPPPLLRSLPVELLYDDRGLELFDQITRLQEYYLTAAEESILVQHSADILSSCAATDGTLLVELGAGSMRKTRLLLEAVLAAGHKGVTFCALDLGQASLEAALQGLQSVVQGCIKLVGLVGSYAQGLEFISKQQQLQLSLDRSHGNGTSSGSGSSSQLLALLDADAAGQLAGRSSTCSDSGASDSAAAGDSGSLEDVCITVGEAPAGKGDSYAGAGRILLWLGSSIGNFTREQGSQALRRIREQAMQPGDRLLVGMDRRNPAAKVALAYNDPQGVTRDFILNGLAHARRLLEQQLPAPTAGSAAALEPSHFRYVSVVNEELGRHEAYLQACQDTSILLPQAAAAAVAATAGATAPPAAPGDAAVVPVAVRAGELIHVEYSHKYSHRDVLELASAAGLEWVRCWPDSKEQYDLHLFTLPAC